MEKTTAPEKSTLSILDKPPVGEVFQREDKPGKRHGERTTYLCLLHDEKTPSFVEYPNGTGHCFGCGWHGDSIDLVMKRYGYDFKEACEYLGITLDNPHKTRKQREKIQNKREAIARFKTWRQRRITELLTLIQILDQKKLKAQPGEVCRDLSEFYRLESIWQYELEILTDNSAEDEQIALYGQACHG